MNRPTSTPRRTTRRLITRSPPVLRWERHGDGATSTNVSSEPAPGKPAGPLRVIRKARHLARRSVAVMGLCEIGYFACGRGAVDLSEHAQLRPFLPAYTTCRRLSLRPGCPTTRPLDSFCWEGNLMT